VSSTRSWRRKDRQWEAVCGRGDTRISAVCSASGERRSGWKTRGILPTTPSFWASYKPKVSHFGLEEKWVAVVVLQGKRCQEDTFETKDGQFVVVGSFHPSDA